MSEKSCTFASQNAKGKEIVMEDLIVRIPHSDATFVAQLLEKMGYSIRNKAYQGERSHSFMPLFNAMREQAQQDHEWTLDEINAEIAEVRQARAERFL